MTSTPEPEMDIEKRNKLIFLIKCMYLDSEQAAKYIEQVKNNINCEELLKKKSKTERCKQIINVHDDIQETMYEISKSQSPSDYITENAVLDKISQHNKSQSYINVLKSQVAPAASAAGGRN